MAKKFEQVKYYFVELFLATKPDKNNAHKSNLQLILNQAELSKHYLFFKQYLAYYHWIPDSKAKHLHRSKSASSPAN